MATVVKSWTWTGGLEGFTAIVGSFAYTSNLINIIGTATGRTGAGVTWETWGVPAGATVTAVNATIQYGVESGAGVAPAQVTLTVYNSSNTTIHSAGAIYTNVAITAAFPTLGTGTQRAVDASYQASTTAVKMNIDGYGGQWDDGFDIQADILVLDTLALTITYTEGGPSFVAKLRRAFSQFSQRVGVRQAQ